MSYERNESARAIRAKDATGRWWIRHRHLKARVLDLIDRDDDTMGHAVMIQ